MADVSNQSDCIIKDLRSEMKGVQEKESVTGVRARQKNPSLVITVWYHLASLVMPDSEPWDRFFYLHLTPMIDPYNLWQSGSAVLAYACLSLGYCIYTATSL